MDLWYWCKTLETYIFSFWFWGTDTRIDHSDIMPGSHYSCVWSVWTDRVVWDVLERLQHLGTRWKQHQQLPNPPRQILCVEVKLLTACTLHGHTHTIILFHLSHLYYKLLCICEHFWCSHPPQGCRGPSRCWGWAVWSRPASPAGRTA